MSPGPDLYTFQDQLLKSCPFGSNACTVQRAGLKIIGGAFVEGGRAWLGCQLCGSGLLETWKNFVISVQLQLVGKQ